MKKLIILSILVISFLSYAQAPEHDYVMFKKYTTAKINSIDTTLVRTYFVENSDTNKFMVNRRDGNGWVELFTAGGSSTWGGITGTLSNQTDLQNALDAKAGLATSNTFTNPNTFSNITVNTEIDGAAAINVGGNIFSLGTVTGSNLSGTNTGDQDLTGYAQKSITETITGAWTFDGGATFNYGSPALRISDVSTNYYSFQGSVTSTLDINTTGGNQYSFKNAGAASNPNDVLRKSDGDALYSGGGGGLNNIVEDTTPELGGDLDVLSRKIISSDNIIELGNPNDLDSGLQILPDVNETSLFGAGRITLSSANPIHLLNYGLGNRTGTSTYNLGVDTNGYIVETANPDLTGYAQKSITETITGAWTFDGGATFNYGSPALRFTDASANNYNLQGSATSTLDINTTGGNQYSFKNAGAASNPNDVLRKSDGDALYSGGSSVNTAFRTPAYNVNYTEAYNASQPNFSITVPDGAAINIEVTGTGNGDSGQVALFNAGTYGSITQTGTQTGNHNYPATGFVWLYYQNVNGTIFWGCANPNITAANSGDFVSNEFNIGNGSLTTIALNHALNASVTSVLIKDNATNEVITPGSLVLTDANNLSLTFATAPTTNGYTVKVVGTSLGAPDTENPTAPTLTASNPTSTTVDLSWTGATDNVAVTGYRVYKDAVLEATLGNVTTYQVTGLTASTSYDFTVTALDVAGNESVASNTVTETTTAGSTSSVDNSGTIIDSGMSGSFPSTNAFDGNLTNRYLTSSAQNGWVGRDYGVAKTVDRVRVLPFQNATDYQRINDCQIQYSTDGTTYTTIYTITGIDGANYTNWVDIPASSFTGGVAISARYWRIKNDRANTFGGNNAEIEFYTQP